MDKWKNGHWVLIGCSDIRWQRILKCQNKLDGWDSAGRPSLRIPTVLPLGCPKIMGAILEGTVDPNSHLYLGNCGVDLGSSGVDNLNSHKMLSRIS